MDNVESRRKFLKKAAYVAPVVVALGGLTAPMSAHASYIHTKSVKYDTGKNVEVYKENDGSGDIKRVITRPNGKVVTKITHTV
jgi:hypothetical protein